jgi:cation:H+ antiporter
LNDIVIRWIQSFGSSAPWLCVAIFLIGSLLMIWRLESLGAAGMEGTVLGTLVMPYCSGLGNLIFAFVLGRAGGDSREVMTNCLVNNVTNMTLIIGMPALFWGLSLAGKKSAKPAKEKAGVPDKQRVSRLSLLLTILAAAFFTGVAWALGRDGTIGFTDGLVLVGIFLFWQAFHVFEALKGSAKQKRVFGFGFLINATLLLAGAYAVYISTDWLVSWLQGLHSGFLSAKHLGWLSGWLMVLPNALLALYYAEKKRAEVVYSSQIGDGHICIPLCIGVFALFKPIPTPDFFQLGVWILLGAVALHFLFIALLDKLPRLMGALLIAAYAVFVWKGLGKN